MATASGQPLWLSQMKDILETLNEGVVIVNDIEHIIFANQRMMQMCGFSLDEVRGLGPDHFYHGEDLLFVQQQIALSVEHGHHRYEFHAPRKGGAPVPVIVSARRVEGPDGHEVTVITFTDITEQKRAQEELEEANRKLRKRQQEIEQELELASRVQQSLAPQTLRWGPFAIEAFYSPVNTIGGDFGLVMPLGEEELNVLVCDVAGHGISSALVANRIYSELVSLLERRAGLPEMLERLNEFVLQHIRLSNFYFSMAVGRLEQGRRHRMMFASAGHPPALWVAPDGECRPLETRNTVLGLLPQAVAPEPTQEVELSPGDRIVLYTDGLTEVFNHRGEMLGYEGFEEMVRKAAQGPLAEMKQSILDQNQAWRHGPPVDDVSLVLVELQAPFRAR